MDNRASNSGILSLVHEISLEYILTDLNNWEEWDFGVIYTFKIIRWIESD